jgi:hypothetical protein
MIDPKIRSYELLAAIDGFWKGVTLEGEAFARRQIAIAEMNADSDFSGDSSWNLDGTIEDDVSETIYGEGRIETFAGCFV